MASWQDKFLKPVTEDMEDFTAAMDAVNVDLDEFLSRYWLTWLAYVNVRLHLKPKSRDSFVPSFLRSFVPSFLRSFARSFVRSFSRSFVRSFIHSFHPMTLSEEVSPNSNSQDACSCGCHPLDYHQPPARGSHHDGRDLHHEATSDATRPSVGERTSAGAGAGAVRSLLVLVNPCARPLHGCEGNVRAFGQTRIMTARLHSKVMRIEKLLKQSNTPKGWREDI